jgi:hypothetical protein
MVGGKSILYTALIILDLAFFSFALNDIPKFYLMLYLVGTHAFDGAIKILRGMEAKKLESPSWKFTVVTGGMAAGFAIAGAAMAVTALVMNETGAMEALTNKLSEHLQEKYGMSKSQAQLAASLIINISIMVLQLGCSIGSMVSGIAAAGKAAADAAATGAKAAGEAAKISAATLQTARQVQTGITVANTGVGVVSLGTSALTTYRSFMADSSKADTTELEKFMTMLQQRLEESQEELQKILEQIQSGIGELAQMIGSATDTSAEIAQNIGQMA